MYGHSEYLRGTAGIERSINQLERLETLAAQSDNSESERKALRQAIAELKQLIHPHAC